MNLIEWIFVVMGGALMLAGALVVQQGDGAVPLGIVSFVLGLALVLVTGLKKEEKHSE